MLESVVFARRTYVGRCEAGLVLRLSTNRSESVGRERISKSFPVDETANDLRSRGAIWLRIIPSKIYSKSFQVNVNEYASVHLRRYTYLTVIQTSF